jgi:cytochrome c oxidase subunit 3
MSAPAVAHGHKDSVDHDAKLRFGMLFYVITDVIFVVFLLTTYVWLRAYNTSGGWFPQGTKLPDMNMSNLLTGLIVLSAVCYYVAQLGLKQNNQALFRGGVAVALLLVLATLVGQIWYMGHFPFMTTDGSFASTYIMLSGYHVYHLLLATFLGLGITHRALRGRYSSTSTVGVTVIGFFWYWTALLPVLVTLLLLALPPQL